MTLQRINVNEEKRLQVIWNNVIVLFQENTAVGSRLPVCVHSRKSNLVICDTTTSWGRLIFFRFFQKKNPSERRCYSEIPGSPEEHVISTNRGENSQSVGTGQLTGHLKIILRHDTWHWQKDREKHRTVASCCFFAVQVRCILVQEENLSLMQTGQWWHPDIQC